MNAAGRAARQGLMGGAALAAAVAMIAGFEGRRNAPYHDMAGVLTVCHGETQVPMRRYSDAECAAMLRRRVEHDYAKPVLACVPALAHRPGPLVASVSLAYNIGVGAFCRSTVARRFNAGDWAGGCDAFRVWTRANGAVVPGLVRRREAERRMCLTPAAAVPR